jgi:hypothetical protein
VKRDPALVSLSRDHHLALVVAQKLSLASAETAAEARAALAAYWDEHGRAHFRLEEEVLFPAYGATATRTTRFSPGRCVTTSRSANGSTRTVASRPRRSRSCASWAA